MLSIATAQLGWAPIVPVTTRTRRSDEVDGEDYHFMSRDEFRRRIRQDYFAEWDMRSGTITGVFDPSKEWPTHLG